jgi:putative ABC transport system permease protein
VTVTATQGGAAGASRTQSRASGSQAGASGAQAGGPPDMGPGGLAPADMMAAIQEEQAALAAQDTSGLDTPLLERIAGRTVSPDFFNAWGLKAAEGSLFSANDVENSKTVMVVGSALAKTLFKDGTAMGKRLKIEGRIYTIIGVLEANDLLDTNGVRKVNEMAFMPPRSFTRKVGNTTVNMGRPIMSLTFFVKDRSKIGSAVKELQAFFDRSYKEGQVKVTSRQSTLNSRRSGQNALFGAISVLALLCLVVATLNIFNVSSIKTIRRRRSLGILRAIGASRQKAMLVFLVEVALLALSGSFIGLAAALPMSGVAIKALVPTGSGAISVNWWAEIIAALLSMVLPLAAGLFPAWRLLAQAPADLVRPE